MAIHSTQVTKKTSFLAGNNERKQGEKMKENIPTKKLLQLLHQSSYFSQGASSITSSSSLTTATSFLSFDSREKQQQQPEIIMDTSTLSVFSSSKEKKLLPKQICDGNVSDLHHKRRDSDGELAGLQFLAENDVNDDEEDNWDALSVDNELCILVLDDDDEYFCDYSTIPPPPASIESPSSVMTNKLYSLMVKS